VNVARHERFLRQTFQIDPRLPVHRAGALARKLADQFARMMKVPWSFDQPMEMLQLIDQLVLEHVRMPGHPRDEPYEAGAFPLHVLIALGLVAGEAARQIFPGDWDFGPRIFLLGGRATEAGLTIGDNEGFPGLRKGINCLNVPRKVKRLFHNGSEDSVAFLVRAQKQQIDEGYYP